jgi:hypothetical protein
MADAAPIVLEVSACGGCPALAPYQWGCKVWMARNPGWHQSVSTYLYSAPPEWCPLREAGATLRVREKA